MQKPRLRTVLILSIVVAISGLIAGAQKTEAPPEGGVTLADLGVTEAQKEKIKALWERKRQKHIQAIDDLRTLNRIAKDAIASDHQIQETLEIVRQKSRAAEKEIRISEDALIETLPPRAQLHLTILGVLDNGLAPRSVKKDQKPRKTDNLEKRDR